MSGKKRKCVLLVRFGENEQHSSVPQMMLSAAAIKECGRRKLNIIMVMTEHLCEGRPILTNGLAEAIRMCKKDCDDISLIVVCNPLGHVMSDEEKYMTEKMAIETGIDITWLDKISPVENKNWTKYLRRFEYVEEEN